MDRLCQLKQNKGGASVVRFSADKPIYVQIVDALSARIVTRYYEPGTKFPTVRDLAIELGVNPNTVQRALSDLEQRGFLYSERTSGRFVTEDKARLDEARTSLISGEAIVFVKNMKRFECAGDELLGVVRSAVKECNNDF